MNITAAAAAKLETSVEGLKSSIKRLDHTIASMRKENDASHNAVRACINTGLVGVHKRIDRLQTTIVARWFALGATVILILLGIVGWLITYLTKMQTGL